MYREETKDGVTLYQNKITGVYELRLMRKQGGLEWLDTKVFYGYNFGEAIAKAKEIMQEAQQGE